MNKIVLSIAMLIAGAMIMIAPVAAVASGGGEEGLTFVGDWLPRLVNFIIIAGVLVYFGRKPVRDFFANRTTEIAKAIEESRVAREKAAQALAEMERKMKALEAETSSMIADATSRGEKDKEALIAEGKKVAEDVQAQVRTSIEIEVQKAKAGLSAEAALLAIELAEGSVKEKITKQDHERILKEYISKVGGKG